MAFKKRFPACFSLAILFLLITSTIPGESGASGSSSSSDDSSSSSSGDEELDPLAREGWPFAGLIKDIKIRYSQYPSDFKDAINLQVLSAFFFIYFAALSPAITFGGLMSDKTGGMIGASEVMLGTALGGIVYSLFSGQPLLIAGVCGTMMVFDEGVHDFAVANGIDFLAWRAWIGIWVCIIGLICVAAEASFLVKYVSRFTQEIFAFLISLIFIYEVFVKLSVIFRQYPLCHTAEECDKQTKTAPPPANPSTTETTTINATVTVSDNTTTSANWINSSTTTVEPTFTMTPNTALLSMFLTLATFTIAYFLKGMRNKKVFGRHIRRALGDFGVPISILIMCVVDYFIGDDVFTQKLYVPSSIIPTVDRNWIINPLGKPDSRLPIAHIFSAAIPALLASILIFMETLICGLIVSKKENHLKKGTGFHLDITVVGVLAMIHGILGLPLVCCATVRSVSHTSALTVVSRPSPNAPHKVTGVIEQRVSNLVVHILIAASMFAGVVLSYIPIAVLFGVFLYMGVASLGGIQLFERCFLIVTPRKHHPQDHGYVKHVSAKKMHIFTLIQLACLGVLWGIKSSPASLSFPFFIVLLIPLRIFLLKYIFTEEELKWLDAPTAAVIEKGPDDDDEPDFYETADMPD